MKNRTQIIYIVLIILSILWLGPSNLSASQKNNKKTDKKVGKEFIEEGNRKYVRLIPGREYEMAGIWTLFFGSHWRVLWTTPIKVDVLDLDNFAGGLTPHKRGGGMQTKSLRFKGKDGKIWKFRSVNKDPRSVLPKELRETFVRSVVQDQISSANPLAALMLPPILNAVNILQAEPMLVWMPDDERLGQFRNEFGGVLGTIELHPKGKDREDTQFETAQNIISTWDLFKLMETDRSHKVNAAEYLKARLVDVFVGDWDRHSDQWLWAMYKEKGKKKESWYPIPRDRDQAFAKLNGLFPWLSRNLIIHLCHFSKNYPTAKKITWSGRFVDRRFLTELDKKTWDYVTAEVKSQLTDDVIERAVKRLPPEHFKKAGRELIAQLKNRRNHLNDISEKYFLRINKVLDVYTSHKDDYVLVERIDDRHTQVEVYKRTGKKGKLKGKPYWLKKTDNRITKEIRIFLEDGDDRAEIRGRTKRSPLIRVIGGNGIDELADYSISESTLNAKIKTIFYDSGKSTLFRRSAVTKIVTSKWPNPKSDYEKYENRLRNRDRDWFYLPLFSYNPDDGFLVGASAMVNKYNFRAAPNEFSLSMSASYATRTNSHQIKLRGAFNALIRGASLHLELIKTQLLFNDYYGFGNTTTISDELEDKEYYETAEEFYIFRPSLHFKIFSKASVGLGLAYTVSDISIDNPALFLDNHLGEYGLGRFERLSLFGTLTYDSRDNAANPHKGIYLHFESSYTPNVFDSRYGYLKNRFDFRYYLPLKPEHITLALRAGGSGVFGDYPFFEAAFLGGGSDLRGYRRKRFAGDAALFGQAELRTYIGKWNIIMPGRFGIHLFIDGGKVFVNGITSDKIHTTYGGGLFIALAKRMVSTSLTIAKSQEALSLYFALKLMY